MKTASGTLLYLLFIAATFVWFEAEKEIRILCSMFPTGTSETSVTNSLDTGTFLEYRQATLSGSRTIIADSPYMLRSSQCVIRLGMGASVRQSEYRQPFDLAKTAAWMGGVLLVGLALLIILLAAALPFGRTSRQEMFSAKLLLAGAFSMATLTGGALLLLEKARITNYLQIPDLAVYAVWIMAVLFGIIGFWAPKSERTHLRMARRVLAHLLCCLCIIVAMEG